jgi:hypothetical protein
MRKSLKNTFKITERKNIGVDKLIKENFNLKILCVILFICFIVSVSIIGMLYAQAKYYQVMISLTSSGWNVCMENWQNTIINYVNCMCGNSVQETPFNPDNPFNIEPPSILMPEYIPNETQK